MSHEYDPTLETRMLRQRVDQLEQQCKVFGKGMLDLDKRAKETTAALLELQDQVARLVTILAQQDGAEEGT